MIRKIRATLVHYLTCILLCIGTLIGLPSASSGAEPISDGWSAVPGSAATPPPAFPSRASSAATTISETTAPSDREENSQEEEPASKLPELTVEQVQAALAASLESKEIPAETRTKITEEYNKALENLAVAREFKSKTAAHEKTIAEAAERLEKRRARLTSPFVPFEPDPLTTTLTELESVLTAEVEKLENSKKKMSLLENEAKRRQQRRKEILEQEQAARERLVKIWKEVSGKPDESEGTALAEARRALLLTRRQAIRAEIEANKKEIEMFDATREVVPIDRDLGERTVSRYHQRVAIAKDAVNARRRIDATNQEREARITAEKAAAISPVVQEIATRNAELATRRNLKAKLIAEASARLTTLGPTLTKIQFRSKLIREKVETGGLTEETGTMLRNQRADLPNAHEHARSIREAQAELIRTQLVLIDIEAERASLYEIPTRAEQITSSLDPSVLTMGVTYVREMITKLLETQRNYLDSLINDSRSLQETLTELVAVEQNILEETESFSDYVAERILWVKSDAPLRANDLARAWSSLQWLGSPDNWRSLYSRMRADAWRNPATYVASVLGVVLLAFLQRRTRRSLRAIGQKVEKNYLETSGYTVVTLALTLFLAASWPAIITFVAWRVLQLPEGDTFDHAVGKGLLYTAAVYLMIEFLRQVCRHRGLADSHFRWRDKSLKTIRRNLHGMLILELPLVFIVMMMQDSGNEAHQGSLGRLAFIAGLIVLARFTQALLNPSSGVVQDVLANLQGGWMDRLRVVLYPVALLAPLCLATFAALGYYYPAQKTAVRLIITVLLGCGLAILNAIMLRWLFAARGRLAMEQTKKRRAVEQQAQSDAMVSANESIAAALEVESIDLSTINLQTRALLRSAMGFAFLLGIWLTWADVMPALRILNQVEIGHSTVSVAETVETADGSPQVVTKDVRKPVTLVDAIKALLIAAMTLIAARNIPGLLEISLLTRLPLDAGGRYATATLCRYTITLFGIVFAANQVGIGWSNVQWLAAAISVGLGFGLQEIFANFVSGLILLFERPIRVGDLVTVGDRSGTITKIRIRATTILDFDKKEMVVPNKSFITDRIVNWTLSDRMIRLVFEVGVAYESDTALTRELLLRAATEHPKVLKEPAPSAIFDGFGDSCLNFLLRCFLSNIDDLAMTKHEINTRINALLKEHGVEIPYPHHEIFIKSAPDTITLPERTSRSA